MSRADFARFFGPALAIGGTALLATGTLIVHGNSCGHDFDFHLLSWMEVVRGWHSGVWYPHWVQDANFGAGEPRLIFYPPASWILGGTLGAVFGWYAAPVLFILLALGTAGLGMYRLAREWTPPGAATLAACLYAANPYAMFVAYERSALGELLAAAWLPWMVRFALRPGSSIAPLGLSLAALWLTNSPSAVVASYLLALLASGMWIAERKAWPAVRAAAGMALGLGLAAFYIVPAVVQQQWVQIERAIDPEMRVEDSFLFAHTADAFHDQVLRTASWIFVAEMAVAVIAASLAWKRRADGNARVVLSAILPVILLLQLPGSEAIWKYAPHLKFLQFPWRWLLALNVALCVLAAMAAAVYCCRAKVGRMAAVVAMALIVTLAAGGGLLFFQPCDDEDAVVAQIEDFRLGRGTEGTDEYTPKGADNARVQQGLPLVRVLREAREDEAAAAGTANPEWQAGNRGSLPAAIQTKRLNEEHWIVNVTTAEAGYAVLRLMDYPSWRVTVDGRAEPTRAGRVDGLMTVPIGPGTHTVDVQWFATRDIVEGRTISAIALVALGGVTLWERRRRPV